MPCCICPPGLSCALAHAWRPPAPCPLLPPVQPLDALGTVLEGGLLGASDTGYLGARTAASCAVSLLVLGIASLTHGSLLAVRGAAARTRAGACARWGRVQPPALPAAPTRRCLDPCRCGLG